MKFRRNRSQGIQPGDRVTLTGIVTDVARDLGHDTSTAIVAIDAPGLPEGYICTLRIDTRVLDGDA